MSYLAEAVNTSIVAGEAQCDGTLRDPARGVYAVRLLDL